VTYSRAKLTFVLLAGLAFLWPHLISREAGADTEQRSKVRPGAQARPLRDYSNFTHHVPQHQRACDACHNFPSANWKAVRKGDEAFPDVTDYPQHASCLKCHRQQFFAGATPTICRVCHVQPSPRNGARYPFPNPRVIFDASPKGRTESSEYGVYFPHEKHQGLFGKSRPGFEAGSTSVQFVAVGFRGETSTRHRASQNPGTDICSKCHQTYQPQGESADEFVTKPPAELPENSFWLRKGTFKTAPQSHVLCFTCHSEDAGLKPTSSDCGTCHKLIAPQQAVARKQAHGDFDPRLAATMGLVDRSSLEKWQRRESVKFRHEWVVHVDISCTDCHKVATINPLSEKGPEVPVLSCGGSGSGCHITPTMEEAGALNSEVSQKKSEPSFQCIKCHALLGKKPVPESHIKALAAITDKK
jgi:hypothetical protein